MKKGLSKTILRASGFKAEPYFKSIKKEDRLDNIRKLILLVVSCSKIKGVNQKVDFSAENLQEELTWCLEEAPFKALEEMLKNHKRVSFRYMVECLVRVTDEYYGL